MKVSHVALLSFVGMLVASLSVLVFTSPRESSSRPSHFDDAQDAAVSRPIIPAPSSTFRALQAPLSAPSAAPVVSAAPQPITFPSQLRPWPSIDVLRDMGKTLGHLQLSSSGEPCSFFIDGEPVKNTGDITLLIRVGSYVVKCKRSKGEDIERRVDVIEEVITPVLF